METFLIKSAISMAALFLLYKLFLEKEKMHRFNRFYLLFSLIFSLCIPFITVPIYVSTPVTPIQDSVLMIHSVTEQQPVINSVAPTVLVQPEVNYTPYIILGLYCLITALLVIRFAINITRFYRLKKRNQNIPYKGATLVLIDNNIPPHTFLNTVYINKKEYENQSIEPELYSHELTHVKQRHTLDILFIELLKTILWFNPLLYSYKKAIQLNHEFLADENVIYKNDIISYQRLLLNRSQQRAPIAMLASNLNFPITKKRFVMMTKTTPKIKTLALKLACVLTVTAIVYFLSTENVAYAGTQQNETLTATDSVNPDSRRDEYFKGVNIIIQDSLRDVFINTPYEKLTLEQKRYYLANVPKKNGDSDGVSEENYNFSLNYEDSHFYIDNKKISREEFLKHKRKEFASTAFEMFGETKAGEEISMTFMMFFYTYPYYNKHIKHKYDHYPNTTCQITISKTPLEYGYFNTQKAGSRTDKITDMRQEIEISATSNNFEEKNKKATPNRSASFPGGRELFDSYITNNLDLDDLVKDEKTYISFKINTDGSVSDPEIIGNKDPDITNRLKKVFEASPKWIPQQEDGKPVKIGTSYLYHKKTK
ncbi:M56 family metallopeptidase [Flavobacterium rakeshii]|uniref:M56 family metallopeptidase n=1 Tax=Flavobacterium rakeshii TaxID=1038845 RepID=UPI002E7BBF95|nr:M56 family metallopeptidase [Flavobacterium rakeshii]MEE1897863.1 M56 family metallopeptidase [Flavobacterium rakeshii]